MCVCVCKHFNITALSTLLVCVILLLFDNSFHNILNLGARNLGAAVSAPTISAPEFDGAGTICHPFLRWPFQRSICY